MAQPQDCRDHGVCVNRSREVGVFGRNSPTGRLAAKKSHHQLGLVEGLNAVLRRQQLIKIKKQKLDLDVEDAVQNACGQRSRLRRVHNTSPAAMGF